LPPSGAQVALHKITLADRYGLPRRA